MSAGYDALREGAGAYRLPVDVVEVRGPEAGDYLQGQLSQDVAPVRVGASAPALLLEPDGKLCALVRATRTADDAYVLDTDAGFGDAVCARLRKFKLRTKVDIEPLDWPCVALRGAGIAVGEPGSVGAPFELAVEWNGVRGIDLLGPGAESRVPPGAVWCDEADWEALRIEAGIPKMGAELDGRTIAAEAGLVERAVSFTKGCYTGQELVARLDARGNRVARRLCGLVAEGVGPDQVAELRGASLWAVGTAGGGTAGGGTAGGGGADEGKAAGGKAAGRCTSAAWSPRLGSVVGLAYLHRSVEVPADLTWSHEDGPPAAGGRSARGLVLPLVAP